MMINAVREVQITFSGDQERPCGGRYIYATICGSEVRVCLAEEQTGTDTEAGKQKACPRKSHFLHPMTLIHACKLQRSCLRLITFHVK